MSEKLKLYTVKTKDKIYMTNNPIGDDYRNNVLNRYLFNDKKAETSFHKNWSFIVSDKILKVCEIVPASTKFLKYEIIDKSLICDKLSEFLYKEKVYDYDEGDWFEEYKNIKPLYKTVYETVPEQTVDVEFDEIKIMEIEDIPEFSNFEFETGKHENRYKITNVHITHNLIDKIIYPSLFLHNTPCRLTSKQSYDIVRNYIKENIDHSVAKITSDYNFCFTVQKIVPMAKPYMYKVNMGTVKRPKNVFKECQFKDVEIFEMTSKEDKYQDYTPIDEFIGSNEAELKQNIENYCKEIISIINEPIKECEHCSGVGYVFNDALKKNKF